VGEGAVQVSQEGSFLAHTLEEDFPGHVDEQDAHFRFFSSPTAFEAFLLVDDGEDSSHEKSEFFLGEGVGRSELLNDFLDLVEISALGYLLISCEDGLRTKQLEFSNNVQQRKGQDLRYFWSVFSLHF
jgi:hypothetical protein